MSLLSVAQLHRIAHKQNVRILDARSVLSDSNAGRTAYHLAHIPNALFLDLNQDLSAPKNNPQLGRHPMPSAELFCETISRLGIEKNSQVVIYDHADASMAAARAWFLFQLIGHSSTSVLDGGINAWINAGFALDSILPQYSNSAYSAEFNSDLLLTTEQLKDQLENHIDFVLIDARAPERFRGELEPIDKKAGHIPGAVNRPYNDNLQAGLFKSPEQLRAEFLQLIKNKNKIALSCGSGVTACHHALAMHIAGIQGARLYAPSWSGWIAEDSNSIALGAA